MKAIPFSAVAFLLVPPVAHAAPTALFLASDNCQACHNGISTDKGEDVSIGIDWRASMMANAARDPYWQASVRRETLEHAVAAGAIENECSLCHMPMAHVQARSEGRMESVFANLTRGNRSEHSALAQDGVSCSLCHQIEPDKLGKPESFVGGFVVDTSGKQPRRIMGPFEIKPPLARLMASATGFLPEKADHIRSSELCATCHTLITETLGPDGKPIGRLPEQVPFLEWLASSYRDSASCVSCHMVEVVGSAPIANLLSDPRTGLARHEFLGGNFVAPALLKRLGVGAAALPQELDHVSTRVRAFLSELSGKVGIEAFEVRDGVLETKLSVENFAGHKLPTAYPSRRAWLHVTVKDGQGTVFFESGSIGADGKIAGNDNDEDASRFEPHRTVIEKAEQVQIYESILGDVQGRVTTGLLHGAKYLKDNRILPTGFDKTKAEADVAVHGAALSDKDFADGSDQVALRIPVGERPGPYKVEVELLYQPIGYRWAENLRATGSAEARAFNRSFDALAARSWQRLAHAERSTLPQTSGTPEAEKPGSSEGN